MIRSSINYFSLVTVEVRNVGYMQSEWISDRIISKSLLAFALVGEKRRS